MKIEEEERLNHSVLVFELFLIHFVQAEICCQSLTSSLVCSGWTPATPCPSRRRGWCCPPGSPSPSWWWCCCCCEERGVPLLTDGSLVIPRRWCDVRQVFGPHCPSVNRNITIIYRNTDSMTWLWYHWHNLWQQPLQCFKSFKLKVVIPTILTRERRERE